MQYSLNTSVRLITQPNFTLCVLCHLCTTFTYRFTLTILHTFKNSTFLRTGCGVTFIQLEEFGKQTIASEHQSLFKRWGKICKQQKTEQYTQ